MAAARSVEGKTWTGEASVPDIYASDGSPRPGRAVPECHSIQELLDDSRIHCDLRAQRCARVCARRDVRIARERARLCVREEVKKCFGGRWLQTWMAFIWLPQHVLMLFLSVIITPDITLRCRSDR